MSSRRLPRWAGRDAPRRWVFDMIAAMGKTGLMRRNLMAWMPDVLEKKVDQVLRLLKEDGHVERDLLTTCFKLTAYGRALHLPLPDPEVRATLINLITDCGEAGISLTTLLAECPGLSSQDMRVAIVSDLMSRHVELFVLPPKHGGGMGYRLLQSDPAAAQAAEAELAAQPLDTDQNSARLSPQPQSKFNLAPDGSFEISPGNGCVLRLSPQVTRSMFAHLDALGGLHTSQHLAGGTAACE